MDHIAHLANASCFKYLKYKYKFLISVIDHELLAQGSGVNVCLPTAYPSVTRGT